jgi:bifunctional DNA-binding transcriptional regulator/antitoxin component of YhaV-PrlF toxin-antitoxin module
MAGLGSDGSRSTDTVYALSAVDKSGRVADRSIVRVLGWLPGTRLDVRERAGLIMVGAACDGVCRIDAAGHLHLPLTVRRWCRLAAGDRVLLAADRAGGVLVAYPLAVLDRLLSRVPAAVVRGEVA